MSFPCVMGFWQTVVTAVKLLLQFDSQRYITLMLQVILNKISQSFLKNTTTCHNATSQLNCLLYLSLPIKEKVSF